MDKEIPSMCDILKSNTSSIIQKLEYQVPINLQIYSDIYKEYLEMMDSIFGACYLAEKNFFDKIAPDQNTRKIMDHYIRFFSELSIMQIENYSSFLKSYSKMRISGMRNFNNFSHQMMNFYSNVLENSYTKSEK